MTEIATVSAKMNNYITPVKEVSMVDLDEGVDIYELYTSTDLYKSLQPFFISLKIFGLHHRKKFHLEITDAGTKNTKKWSWTDVTLSQCYAYLITLLIILNHLRYYSAFGEGSGFSLEFLSKIIFWAWTLLCFNNVVVCLRASHCYSCLPEFFLEWQKLHLTDNEPFCLRFCRKNAYLYSIVCYFLVIWNIAATVYLLCFTNMYESWLAPFDKSMAHINVVYGVFIPILIFLSAAWIFPIALQYITCKILYQEFKRFNACFRRQQKQNNFQIFSNFETMRQKHQQLCKLVDHADDFLALYHAGVVMFAMVGICINMYSFIWFEKVRSSLYLIAVHLLWSLSILLKLGFVCIGGALVNHQVIIFQLLFTFITELKIQSLYYYNPLPIVETLNLCLVCVYTWKDLS